MVVIVLPVATETGVTHELTASPSRWTVQAPQSPAPHPNFVPVSSRVSRSTQSRGVSGGTSILCSVPLTRRVISDIVFPWVTGMASDVKGNGEKGKSGHRAGPDKRQCINMAEREI